jgi:6-pyruvoyltetrahydropterin/6-carboxytetrahydropterin synthase
LTRKSQSSKLNSSSSLFFSFFRYALCILFTWVAGFEMYEVKIKTDFSAAHNLREVGGKCESLHGHNFTVEVAVQSETLEEGGMVIDFRLLKSKVREVLDSLDHKYLNELPFFRKINPSSENLAAYIYGELAKQIDQGARRVSWVSVWESETSRAVYRRS